MAPSLEGWPNKAKEVPSPHEVRLALLDTNAMFQCVRVDDDEKSSKNDEIDMGMITKNDEKSTNSQ